MEHRADSAEQWEHRIDRGELLSAVRRDDGTALLDGYAAREGIYPYRRPDGSIRRELVRADMLKRTMGRLARAPVTLHHPDPQKHPRGVTPDNHAELVVGDTDGDVWLEDGGFVRCHIALRRRDALDALDAGTRELSPGYDVQLDNRPGTHPTYGDYDCVQVDRRYNHLALVDAARGGPEIRVRADSSVSTTVIRADSAGIPTGGRLKLSSLVAQLVAALGLSQQRFDTDEAALDGCVSALRARNDASDREKQSHQARLDAEKARADGLQAKLTQLEAAETQRRDAAERAELENTAKSYGIEDPSKHQDSAELRRQVASKFLGREVRADEGDIYIRQIVKAAGDVVRTRSDGREAGRKAWEGSTETQTRQDNGGPKLSPLQRARQRTDAARKGGEA